MLLPSPVFPPLHLLQTPPLMHFAQARAPQSAQVLSAPALPQMSHTPVMFMGRNRKYKNKK